MAKLTVIAYPNPILAKQASPIAKIDARLKELAQDMIETMYEDDGVGLAAPQVSVSKRMIVVSPNAKRGEERVLINPEIFEKSDEEELGTEGCLSLPGISVDVRRSVQIKLRAMDLKGKKIEESLEGFPARVVQHELDHLNGKLLLDHLGFDQRQQAITQATRRL